uniref:acid phosphatase n=1 Tax=Diabrotica virgifera virgifera TaxID=50390 RepID=A0A6P7GVX9_DIAVI
MANLFQILFFAYIVFYECTSVFIDNKNLLAVVQIFRHGQRTPTVFYPNDKYANPRYWKGVEKGELTNEGKKQQYDLGKFTRKRYQGWLSTRYDNKEFYAQTTDYDRTQMSALANIYGLFPAKNDQVWYPLTNWQPIPIHVADLKVLAPFPPTSCVGYYSAKANYLSSKESLALDAKYLYVYEYLNKKIAANITSYAQIHPVYDSPELEQQAGLKLPEWATMVFPQPLKYLTTLFFDASSHTRKLQRLTVGSLMYEIINYFDTKAVDPKSSPKFQMYSAHDYTLSALLNTLEAYNLPPYIEFASSVYIELRKDEGQHYVNIWFKNDPENMEKIIIKGCTFNCPLETVKVLLKDILVDVSTKETECNTIIPFVSEVAATVFEKMIKHYGKPK